MKQEPTYKHKEAFCLMTYRSLDGSITERVWNSRDGVTPFMILSKCKKHEMEHVSWEDDKCTPEHSLKDGERYFTGVDREYQECWIDSMIEKYWSNERFKEIYESKENARKLLATECPIGSPCVKVFGERPVKFD